MQSSHGRLALRTWVLSLSSLLLYVPAAFGWQHGLSMGYGSGKEVAKDYINSGMVIGAKFYRFQIDPTLIATLDGTYADINCSTESFKQTTTVAVAAAFRAYFFCPERTVVKPYLQASFGPGYISNKQLGDRIQGEHFLFQSTLELGTEIGCRTPSIDINLRLIHYCNAGLFRPNNGIDLMPVLSIGYLF